MSKRGWILLGTAVPVLAFIALLVWASLKTGDAVDITFRPSKRGPDMRIESMSRDDADAAP